MNDQLKLRTKQLALRIIRLVAALPTDVAGQVIGRQLLRCGTSVGANYRAASRAKSTADMINKLKIVEEETDESLYWLELLVDSQLVPEARLADLMVEVNGVLAMTVASIKTLRKRAANNE